MTLAPYVRILGRGPGRARALTQAEAAEAMEVMLTGADAEAVGAILMLLRMKGETADEIAGFAEAARASLAPMPAADLDWPSYAAGRTRGQPWFLLSARLVAQAGYRVTLHGWNGADGAVRGGLAQMGTTDAGGTWRDALLGEHLIYVGLEDLSPALFRLLKLRDVLGLRSCINTVCRMLNPTGAAASVQGVFHPSYRLLQADAAERLGWQALSVVKGGGGEFECNPSKPLEPFGLRAGAPWSATLAPSLGRAQRLADAPGAGTDLPGLWSGATHDPFAQEVVIGTAALALDTLGVASPRARAVDLWHNRHLKAAA